MVVKRNSLADGVSTKKPAGRRKKTGPTNAAASPAKKKAVTKPKEARGATTTPTVPAAAVGYEKRKTKGQKEQDSGSKLAQALRAVRSKWGDDVIRVPSLTVPYPVIPTGSMIIDKITGIGGIPRGRYTEIYGWESTGKTTLALQIVANATRLGLKSVYLDFEHAMDPRLAEAIGVSFDDETCILIQPNSLEQGSGIMESLIKDIPDIKLYVIDSVPAMVPEKQFDTDIGDTMPIALHARLMKVMLQKLLSPIAINDIAVIFLNHVRVKVDGNVRFGGKPQIYTPGGSIARFLYSLRLSLHEVKRWTQEAESVMGDTRKVEQFNIVRVTAEKNKCGMPYQQGEVALVYGRGTDDAYTVGQVAINMQLIMKNGAWFSYEDEDMPALNFKQQGESAVWNHLRDNPEVMERIADRCNLVHHKTAALIDSIPREVLVEAGLGESAADDFVDGTTTPTDAISLGDL